MKCFSLDFPFIEKQRQNARDVCVINIFSPETEKKKPKNREILYDDNGTNVCAFITSSTIKST